MKASSKAAIEAQLKKALTSDEKKRNAEIEKAKKTSPCLACTMRETCTNATKISCKRLSAWIEKQVFYRRPDGAGLEVICNPMLRDEGEREQEGHDTMSELEYLYYKNRVLTEERLEDFIGCETQESISREQLMALCKRNQIPIKYRPTPAQWQCLLLKVKNEWTNRQLAEHLKISEQAAGKNINKAITKLEAYTNMTSLKQANKVFYNVYRSTFPNEESLMHGHYKLRGFWKIGKHSGAEDDTTEDDDPPDDTDENDAMRSKYNEL